jgi:hypothetical protein
MPIQVDQISGLDYDFFFRDGQEAARRFGRHALALHAQIGLEPGAYAIAPHLVIEPAAHVANGGLPRRDYFIGESALGDEVG